MDRMPLDPPSEINQSIQLMFSNCVKTLSRPVLRYRMRYHFIVAAASKTLQRMRKNQTGWRIDQLQSIAAENGVGWRTPGHGGSHVIFSASGVREIVSVPAKRPIKPVYIKRFLALIDNAVEVRQDEKKNQ